MIYPSRPSFGRLAGPIRLGSILGLSVIAFVFAAIAHPSESLASEDPIAAYSFDEDEGEVAHDFFGSHEGALEHTEWVEGKYGSAIYLDGNNDYVEVPHSSDLELTEAFTLEAWARPDGSVALAPVISKETSNFYSYRLYAGGETAGVPEGRLADKAFSWEDAEAEEALPAKTWSHLALTFDGTYLRLYVNGELAEKRSAPKGQASGGPLLIGASGGEHFFTGKIDEVRLYDRALSVGEVEADENSDNSAPKLTFTGSLLEGISKGKATYTLKVHATDGEPGKPGVGVKSIEISVDGSKVDGVEQSCPEGNCSLDREWTYNTETYGEGAHNVEVKATDQGGMSESQTITLTPPDGDIPGCKPLGAATTSTPTKTTSLPHGGTADSYTTSDEAEYEFPNPPNGFNPMTATSEELIEYGFPERPSEPGMLEEWESELVAAEHAAPPSVCTEDSGIIQSGESEETSSEANYFNWAGFVTNEPHRTNKWVAMQAGYTQVGIHQPSCVNSTVSSWVGLGGFKSSRLIQIGSSIDEDGNFHTFVNRLSKEVSPYDHHLGLVVHPGDIIHVWMNYQAANNRAELFILDKTTGGYRAVKLKKIGSGFYDGSSGDFIDERQEIRHDHYSNLKNFDTASWRGARVQTSGGGWQRLGKVNRVRLHMIANNGTQLAAPGFVGVDSMSFKDNWFHCHG